MQKRRKMNKYNKKLNETINIEDEKEFRLHFKRDPQYLKTSVQDLGRGGGKSDFIDFLHYLKNYKIMIPARCLAVL
jgi:hypothetical protein